VCFHRYYTVAKAKRDAGTQQASAAENSVIHVDRSEKSVIPIHWAARHTYVDGGIFQRLHVVLLRHVCFFKQCIELKIGTGTRFGI
jgi:hypothetical protein